MIEVAKYAIKLLYTWAIIEFADLHFHRHVQILNPLTYFGKLIFNPKSLLPIEENRIVEMNKPKISAEITKAAILFWRNKLNYARYI